MDTMDKTNKCHLFDNGTLGQTITYLRRLLHLLEDLMLWVCIHLSQILIIQYRM